MKVVCTGSNGSEIEPPDHGFHYSATTEFQISRGSEYLVFGMSLYNHALYVLIVDDRSLPSWYPIAAFVISDPELPAHWEYLQFRDERSLPKGTFGLQGLWGYPELARSSAHYEGLIDLDPTEIQRFRSLSGSNGGE